MEQLDIYYSSSFLKVTMKMADVDIDPFGEHESRPDEPMNENIPLPPINPGGGTRT